MRAIIAALWLIAGFVPGIATAQGPGSTLVDQAQRYEHGEGVPQDLGRARMLYCEAVQAGSADAAFQLGWTYLVGRGVGRDDHAAARWFLLAVRRGHRQALNVIERFHLVGDASPPACRGETRQAVSPMIPPARIAQLVTRLAAQQGLDPQLVLAVIKVESAFQPHALSAKKAQGLMQLIPETAARFGVSNAFEIQQNLIGGMRYLRWLLSYFRGDVTLALAAYNAGEGRVDDYGGVPPFPETRSYVQRIRQYYAAEHHAFDPNIASASPVVVR